MTQVLFFIAGSLFIVFVLPILQGISEIFTSYLSCKSARWSLEVQQLEIEINNKIKDSETSIDTQCIGFQVKNEPEEYYIEEDKKG